jgi:dolichyl-phosphate-mannose-protein mannosyltransferase
LWGLQKHGGYAAVAANHRQYVLPLSDWGRTAVKQLWHIGVYDNWLGVFHEPFVVFHRGRQLAEELSGAPMNHPAPDDTIEAQVDSPEKIAALVGQAAALATPLMLLAVTIAACAWSLHRDRRLPASSSVWLLTAWIGGLTVATPFYHPYPRLVLPWLLAAWLGVGLAVQRWRERSASSKDGVRDARPSWKPGRLEWVVIIWLVACDGVRSCLGTAHIWRDRNGVQTLAAQLTEEIRSATAAAGHPSDEAIVYVYGQPAMLFGLKASGLPLIGPIQAQDFPRGVHPRPVFLVALHPNLERFLWNRRPAFVSHLVWYDEDVGLPWQDHYDPLTTYSIEFGFCQQPP